MQRIYPFIAGGFTFGLVVAAALWLLFGQYARPFTTANSPGIDQRLVTSMIELGINNPEVQTIIKTQIVHYLKSPEGQTRMAEFVKSPEMVKALSENIQSPELRSAIIELMKVPEFRREVIDIVKDTPEMKLLTTLSSVITLDEIQLKPAPTAGSQHHRD